MQIVEWPFRCTQCGHIMLGDIPVDNGTPDPHHLALLQMYLFCSNCGGPCKAEKRHSRASSNSVDALIEQGYAAQIVGDDETAEDHYLRAAQAEPGSPKSYFYLAQILTCQQRYDDALRYWLICCSFNETNGLFSASTSMINRFTLPFTWKKHSIQRDTIIGIINARPILSDLIQRANSLAIFMGLCVIGQNPSDFPSLTNYSASAERICNELRHNLWRADMMTMQDEHIFVIAAVLFVARNYRGTHATVHDAAGYYLSTSTTFDYNII